MLQLTFCGGINEIGGNKVLLEDGERRLFLDFGFPFKENKQFYEEYLGPRGGVGLLDPLEMGLLPPLEGLYRDDLVTPGLWQHFSGNPLYCKLGRVDGILLSHDHLDHSGYISFMREDIYRYMPPLLPHLLSRQCRTPVKPALSSRCATLIPFLMVAPAAGSRWLA